MFGRQKYEIYVGFSSDNKNVLGATVSSKPIQVSDTTELFLRTPASSAKSGRQRLWNNTPLLAGALHSSGQQRWPNSNFPQTFFLRMLLLQVPHQREQNSESKELTWHLRHCPHPKSVQAVASIMNLFNLQWLVKEKQRHTKGNALISSDSITVTGLLVIG